jgi:hypothetical protein
MLDEMRDAWRMFAAALADTAHDELDRALKKHLNNFATQANG